MSSDTSEYGSGASEPIAASSCSPFSDMSLLGQHDSEPIAIIGMACRLPGGIRSPSDFWDLMMSRGSPQSLKVPSNRFNIDAYYHPNNERPGSFNVPGGYFVDGSPEDFDPTFFGITPIEAIWMDPQQRKLLEVVYEAFENAGVPLKKVAGTPIGCFIGSFTSDFQQMSFKEHDFRHTISATGVDPGILANRIGHVFDLRGPTVLINTACASSLYALHAACSALRNHDCEGAIVGGSNLILTVDQHMNTAKLGILSPTSQCHTFDESADGYARAESVGALYLKPLSTALRDGDPVRAIVRSTATNSNGKVRGVGISHPSVQGQAEVIRAAYQKAGLDPKHTTYVECHGTGTPTGDPKELQAISLAMTQNSDSAQPVLVGSVKPNIGHSEASSSISTIIKSVLALENGIIPPTAGVTNLSTRIPWEEWHVQAVTEPTEFSPDLPARRIGVNASGYGGTNAHAVLEHAQSMDSRIRPHKAVYHTKISPPASENSNRPHLLIFSAHDKSTLIRNIEVYSAIKSIPNLLDLAYTLENHRSRLPTRAYTICRGESFKVDLLDAAQTARESGTPPTIAFAFTGQGAQWPGMGATLLEAFPSFARTIEELDQVLAKLTNPPAWTIKGCLLDKDSSSRINEAEISQPLCTAVQIGLVRLLAKWNVLPTATVGHSSGEIAAAFTAGYLSAEDAILAAYYRGKIIASANSNGAMLAVGLGAEEVFTAIEGYQGSVVVACHNSPQSVTLSGDASAIKELKAHFDGKKIFAREVKTGGRAYHSHHMKPAARQYQDLLQCRHLHREAVPWKRKQCEMISSVTNSAMGDAQTDAAYLAANLESPVLFNQAMLTLTKDIPSVNMIVEIGPHPALSGPIRQISALVDSPLSYAPTLKRNENDVMQVLKLAGELWTRNSSIDISTVTRVERSRPDGEIEDVSGSLLVDLPPYQWNYAKKYFSESRPSQEHRGGKHSRHDILGRRILGSSITEPQWRNVLRLGDVPWLKHHNLGDEVVFPAAGYFAMAIEALAQTNLDSTKPFEITSFTLRDVSIKAALVVPDDSSGVETVFSWHPANSGSNLPADCISRQWYAFTVSSFSVGDGTWSEHATGVIAANIRNRDQSPNQRPSLPLNTSGKSWYRQLHEVGFNYGPTFQDMIKVRMDHKSRSVNCDAKIKRECGLMTGESNYVIHPGSVDCCLQAIIASIYAGKLSNVSCGIVPTHVDSITFWIPEISNDEQTPGMVNAWTYEGSNRHFLANSQLASEDGRLLLDIQGVHCVAYEAAVPQSFQEYQNEQPYWNIQWKPDISLLRSSQLLSKVAISSMSDLLDMLCHKNASAKVLDIGGEFVSELVKKGAPIDITVSVPSDEQLQNKQNALNDYHSVKITKSDFNTATAEPSSNERYDLIVSTESIKDKRHFLQNCRQSLLPRGFLLSTIPLDEPFSPGDLESAGFEETVIKSENNDRPYQTMLASSAINDNAERTSTQSRSLVLVAPTLTNPLLQSLSDTYRHRGRRTCSSLLKNASCQPGDQVIILTDADDAVLPTLLEDELHSIQNLSRSASHILWATFGGLMSGQMPEHAMVSGMARSLCSENISLDLVTIDFDTSANTTDQIIQTISMIVDRQAEAHSSLETEYAVDSGIVYISRLAPNHALSANQAIDGKDIQTATLETDAKLKGIIQAGKLCFQNQDVISPSLGSTEVEVKTLAIGLNEEDVHGITGVGYRCTCSHEIGGMVTAVGSGVSSFRVGDRVVGFSFDNFSTSQTIPATLICPMRETDSIETMASLPMAFCTAMYGLDEVARIEAGETVLILDNTGAVGLAAAQICRLAKANFLILTACEDTHTKLIDSGFTAEQVVLNKEGNISAEIQRLTRGLGADVIFGSKAVDNVLLQECVLSLAPFGRVALFGRHNSHADVLYGLPSSHEISVSVFDMLHLCEKKPKTAARLLQKCVQLYTDGKISAVCPVKVKSISEIDEAVSSFSNSLVAGKSVITFGNKPIVRTIPSRSPLRFDPDGVYLLVGCLGGLGRSLTTWMIDRGAKHLTFMSRSGSDNPAAAKLVSSIQAQGVEVTVLRGDVARKDDVDAAVRSISQHHQIRGVVNAAMVLNDGMFESMTLPKWLQTISPKVQGSLNLHSATKDLSTLDFFVLTSSTSGILGTPGQSNYAAANAFQDALALHRRRVLSLPACSLILPMILGIGHVADHPEIEDALLRKGIYGIHEDELLAAFEEAMTPRRQQPDQTGTTEKEEVFYDHIIVGLDPTRLASSLTQSETTDAFWLSDPRFSTTLAAINHHSTNHPANNTSSSSSYSSSIISQILKHPTTILPTVSHHIRTHLSRLLSLDPESVDPNPQATQSISAYGLDSMIGTEFRNWLFREFGATVPYQRLLAQGLTVWRLAEELVREVLGRQEKDEGERGGVKREAG